MMTADVVAHHSLWRDRPLPRLMPRLLSVIILILIVEAARAAQSPFLSLGSCHVGGHAAGQDDAQHFDNGQDGTSDSEHY